MADSHHETGVYDATGWMRVATALVVALLSAFFVGCSGNQETPLEIQLVAISTHYDLNAIGFMWEDPDIEVSHWILERSNSADGPWEAVAVKKPGELIPQREPHPYARMWDGGLPPGDYYYYRLYACTDEGRTSYSNVVDGTVPDFMPGLEPPIAPTVELTAPC